ncbi:hypothetical protein PV327_007419 [Microctonus hyperodae]|uniref:Short-chain dehydrogenase/reductase 3 n=1 Tax=Microctonus hyperodae TaxID=165561 RepID=A0AA39KYF8_MICHY|nr:hypothetical protein PV327_007419 [Microctonus hyperodae]
MQSMKSATRNKNSGKATKQDNTKRLSHSQSGEKTKRCFNCGAETHISAECPDKVRGPKCFKCGELGHVATKCVKDIKQEQIRKTWCDALSEIITAESLVELVKAIDEREVKTKVNKVKQEVLQLQLLNEIHSQEILVASDVYKFYLEEVCSDDTKAINICIQTILQSKTDEWYKQRIFRITASNGHKLKEDSVDIEKAIINLLTSSKIGTQAMAYGEKMESVALKEYKKLMKQKFEIVQVGLVVNINQPWLCGSPDAILVYGSAVWQKKLVKVKCPYKCKKIPIYDAKNGKCVQDVVEEIKSTGGECTGYVCDVANKNEVYRVAKLVKIEVGNVTIIVNNAGYVCGKTFMNIPDDEIEKTFRVNILSHYWINKSFMNEMMKKNHGHVVTVASVAGLLGTYNCTDYSAAKFAAVGYHESLFTELKVHGYHGIHTTLVCPYFINTTMFPGVKPRLIAMLEPEYVAEEIVSAILTNEINVTLPRSTRYLLPLKSWMPTKLSWALMYNILQGPQTMMMLQKNREVPKN